MKNNSVLIIAEIGVNHNGKLDLAKKLMVSAKKSGANFVKFQSFNVNELVKKNAALASYQRTNLKKNINQYQMLKKYEIDDDFHKSLIKFSKKINIKFLTSPFDLLSIKYLKKFNLSHYKIPSGEITNIPYLELIGSLNKTTFISTGMSNLLEIKKALKVLISNGLAKDKIYVLHCHTDYPSRDEDLNLLSIRYLKDKLNVNVGYSDHSLGSEASIAAVALGAKVIEKHITLDTNLPGPDHKASMNVKDFDTFVSSIRKTEKTIGTYKKEPSRRELKILKLVRKSICAKKNINKGEFFSVENLTTKRPLKGISASEWHKLIGKKAQKSFFKDELIKK